MKTKISLRGYGFFMPISVMFLIGTCAVVSQKLCGNVWAAGLTGGAALLLAVAQVFFEDHIDEDCWHPGYYTAAHLVDYTILTAVFTVLVSMVAGVWILDFTVILTILVATFALPAGAWVYIKLVGEKRGKDAHPVHPDFDALIWVTPFATGGFLVLNFYNHETWARGLYVVAFVLYFAYMCGLMYYGTRKPNVHYSIVLGAKLERPIGDREGH